MAATALPRRARRRRGWSVAAAAVAAAATACAVVAAPPPAQPLRGPVEPSPSRTPSTATAPTATPPDPATLAGAPPPATIDPQRDWATRFATRPPLTTHRGLASYYADSLAGRPTASGEPYDPRAFTAAHRTLPFGTIVRVLVHDRSRSVYVRINDRGPFGDRRRVIDLSRAAAEALAMLRAGVVPVTVEVMERGDG